MIELHAALLGAVTVPAAIASALIACATVTWGCSGHPAPDPLPPPVVRAPARPVPPSPIALEVTAPACAPIAAPELELETTESDPPLVPVVRGEVLAPFHEALARLRRGLATDHVRIGVYGDSNLTMDYPTGSMRRSLQTLFGDGGHGYVALGQPWSHYQHMDVRHAVAKGFKPYAISTTPIGDGLYGLSGIVVENEWQGAMTWVATAPSTSPVGTRVSSVDVLFLRGKSFGSFDVRVDRGVRQKVESTAPATGLGVFRVEMEDDAHKVEITASSAKRVRLLGAVLERSEPGIVLDSFGVGALNTKTMTRANPDLSREMLIARDYDLIVFMTGANDVFTMDAVPAAMDAIVALQRSALPGVPILVMTPSDRGKRESFRRTLEVVEQRRQIAEDHDCALWDLWAAMGGRDSMSRMLRRGLAHSDAIHFNEAGGAYVGERFVQALLADFGRYLEDHPEAGCHPDDSLYDDL